MKANELDILTERPGVRQKYTKVVLPGDTAHSHDSRSALDCCATKQYLLVLRQSQECLVSAARHQEALLARAFPVLLRPPHRPASCLLEAQLLKKGLCCCKVAPT